MHFQPDDSPAVPKFGDWDENDPASAEGYTQIFNKVREEKQTGAAKVPATSTDASYSNSQKRYGNDSGKVNIRFSNIVTPSQGSALFFPIFLKRL